MTKTLLRNEKKHFSGVLLGTAGMFQPPPYHVFEHTGLYFVYDTTSCRFMQIDAPTKKFLNLCLEMPFEKAKEVFEAMRCCDEVTRESIFREVVLLSKVGLFRRPSYVMSDKEFEAQVEARYSSAWNKLELSLSESCNLACKYCYCATCRDMPNKGLMSERVVRQAITWLFAVSGKSEDVSITFFWGEPLMNKNGFRFAMEYSQRLAKLHGKKVYYSMTTNGTLLDDEIIGYIKRFNFGLMVSLDGNKERHDWQCPTQAGGGSYELAVAGIKRLMQRRRAVTVRCTMIHPLPDMMSLIKFFEEFGFTRIVMGKTTNPVNPSAVDCDETDYEAYFKQEEETLIPWMLEKLQKGETPKYYPYAGVVKMLEEGELSPKVSPFRCGACRGTTTVGADGTLYPCHRFVGMKEWRIGNITDGPDLAKCKGFWRDYRKTISPKCNSCWQWAICKGPCPWEVANADGNFREAYTCGHSERFIKNGVYFYTRKKQMESLANITV
jgi:uncharacterized protein